MRATTNPRTSILLHGGGAMRIRYLALALAALAVSACNLPNEPNLNNPNVGDLSVITSPAQLQAVAPRMLGGHRGPGQQLSEEGESMRRGVGRDTPAAAASLLRLPAGQR